MKRLIFVLTLTTLLFTSCASSNKVVDTTGWRSLGCADDPNCRIVAIHHHVY